MPLAFRRAGELLLLALLPTLLWAGTDFFRPPVVANNPPAGPVLEQPRQSAPLPPTGASVTVETAMRWQQPSGGNPAAMLWVDARTAADYGHGHVPGAVLLNETDWSSQFPSVLERWNPGTRVVVYCDGGDCRASERVTARLRDAGVDPVYVLAGGWPAWQNAQPTASREGSPEKPAGVSAP